MGVLSRILKKIEDGGFIRGFHVGPVNSTGIHISHLHFADDAILFCNASRGQLLSIRLAVFFSGFYWFEGECREK